MRLLITTALALAALFTVSGCDDGCPEGQHRLFITVNNVTTSYCIND